MIHAVGPVYRDGRSGEPELLASCYRTSFALAEERKLRSISFPSISTGVYGYPVRDAAHVALREIRAHLERAGGVGDVICVLFGKGAYEVYVEVFGQLGASDSI